MLVGTKWRITIAFALLASVVCILLATAVYNLFYMGLTSALDDELGALASELTAFVNLKEETSDLESWRKLHAKSALKRIVSIAFFDENGRLVESYGDFALPEIHKDRSELVFKEHKLRLMSQKLNYQGNLVGWLQITVPTRGRDRAMAQLLLLMRFVLPVTLVAFVIVGYFFAGWTIRPIERAHGGLKRFLADASHELKTPLTIAKTHNEALADELADNANVANRTRVISNALDRMQQLIDDLTLLAQTESQQFLHMSSNVSLEQIISSVAEDFAEKCKSKEIEIKCEVSHGDAVIRCDQECIRRAIQNLVENAWRYTNSGGTIKISLEPNQRHARIVVEDNGIGINADSLPHLFERFYRVDKSHSRRDGGSGLGLAIVKGIVEAHGGTVNVQSTPGAGSIFTVDLLIA